MYLPVVLQTFDRSSNVQPAERNIHRRATMSRTMSRPIAMVSLALLLASVSTVQVGSGAVAQEVPEPTAINVEASA